MARLLGNPILPLAAVCVCGIAATMVGIHLSRSRPPQVVREPAPVVVRPRPSAASRAEPQPDTAATPTIEVPTPPPAAPPAPAPSPPAASDPPLDVAEQTRRDEAARRLAAGKMRLVAHDPRGALADLVYAAELDASSAEAREQLGIAYLQLAEHDRARGAFLDALDRDAALADSLEGLGRIAYSEGRYEEAIERLLACLKLVPDRASAKELLERAQRDAPLEAKFREVFTPHFRIKLEGRLDAGSERDSVAQATGDLLERAHDAVGARLSQYPTHVIPVVLYADRQFYEVTGAHPWIGGLFDGKIRIPVKEAFRKDRSLLEKVCRHEYTHALIYMIAPRCPRWLHEGIARVMEGETPNTAWVAAHEQRGLLPPVAKLDAAFRGARTTDEALLVYEMAASFTSYLFARHGTPAVIELLRALGDGLEIDDASRRALGAPLDTIDGEWRQTLAR